MAIVHEAAERAQLEVRERLAQGWRASFTLCAMKLHAPVARPRSLRILVAVAIALGIGIVGPLAFAAEAGRGIEWRDAVAPDRYFQIRFPGPFQAFSDPAETESGHKGITTGVRGNVPAAFGGTNTFVASCIAAPDDERSAKDRIKEVIERWEARTVLAYRKPVDLDGNPGVEFQFADDVKVLRSRVYATADRTCTVLVHWKPYSKPSEADLATFFDSFELLSR
jgi:hypothetical protein